MKKAHFIGYLESKEEEMYDIMIRFTKFYSNSLVPRPSMNAISSLNSSSLFPTFIAFFERGISSHNKIQPVINSVGT
jgi:hypothetical protein